MRNHCRRCHWSTTLFPDPIRLNFALLACACERASERWNLGEVVKWHIYSESRARCTLHMQSVSMANHCRQPFHVFWRRRYYSYRIIVKHIFPKIQFPFAIVQAFDMGACWTRVVDIAESAPLAKGTICSRIGIVFLSLVASARDGRRHTTRLPLINKRWRFYCAYNSIDNLWWCDDDNDDDDEFVQRWHRQSQATTNADRDYCNAYKINQYCYHSTRCENSPPCLLSLTWPMHFMCHLVREFSEMCSALRRKLNWMWCDSDDVVFDIVYPQPTLDDDDDFIHRLYIFRSHTKNGTSF